MKSKRSLKNLLEPRMQYCYALMVVFSVVSALLNLYIGIGEFAVVVLIFVIHLRSRKERSREIERYIQNASFSMDTASKDTMLNTPIPMLLFRPESEEILWCNDAFSRISGESERSFDAKLEEVIPGFSYQWLLDGKKEAPQEVPLGGRRYRVLGHMVRVEGEEGTGTLLATTYWMDITELLQVREDYEASRPVAAIIAIDNYEELFKGVTDSAKSALLAEIDDKLCAWTAPANGLLCKYDRDRYIFVFEEEMLPLFMQDKFSIMEVVRQLTSKNGITASLSIGIGHESENFSELFTFASLALDMALSRGGDQTVMKNRIDFQFFGGRMKETEQSRTKVRSRVMASALAELIENATSVYVMGHKSSDFDALGAAVGICAIARKKGTPCHIIPDDAAAPSDPLRRMLENVEEYHDVFLSAQDAMVAADPGTVVVVVDTSRPEQVCSPALVETAPKKVVIDHHRRASTYISSAALTYHEPSASSACELVAELMELILEPGEVLQVEAEAVLSGIMLDTKNFTMRTGGRTFDAAAYLRRLGADTADLRRLFQDDLNSTIARNDILRQTQMYHENIAIAISEIGTRVAAAQAADALLNVSGVQASFAAVMNGSTAVISGRSLGSINVQLILERLGGGGNANIAGVQMEDTSLNEAKLLLISAIDSYFDE